MATFDELFDKKINEAVSRAVEAIPKTREMFADFPEILKAEQVRQMIDVKDVNTIYTLAKQKSIPNFKVGKEFRFVKQQVIHWMLTGGADPVEDLSEDRKRNLPRNKERKFTN